MLYYSTNTNIMPNPSFYQTSYQTICDCSCDCSCNTDFGNYKFKVIFKNILECIIVSLFFLQFIAGSIFVNKNIYFDISLNNTICNVEDQSFTSLNIQKVLILLGIFGMIMMIFRIINFNFQVYYQEYLKVILFSQWGFNVILLLLFALNIYSIVFFFTKCRYFEDLFVVYVLSMIYNSIVIAGLIIIILFEKISATPENIRAMLLGR